MKHAVNHSQYDRERERLERDLMQGFICNEQYRKAMRELDRAEMDDTRGAAEANAEDAYRDTFERW